MTEAVIIHSFKEGLTVSRYDGDGKLVSEGFKEFVDVKCSGSVRVSRYEFGGGVLIVIEG